uniref:Uncharacterized protein n=1 Tax=Romanomermis culicivorax TaxID=13658 RepID=A0A915L3T3_ROMCU
MLFPEHHWPDYLLTLHDPITEILILATMAPPVMPQQTSSVLMALIVAESVPQLIAAQLLWMVPMDIQPQQSSTSTANLDKHGQLICKPAHYEHSIKRMTKQQEEVQSRKAHKAHVMDEPHARRTPRPSTSHTEHGKMPSQPTTKRHEQRAKQKKNNKWPVKPAQLLVQQPKVTLTRHSSKQTKTAQS